MGHLARIIESLEGRRHFAITASFLDGVLTVNGDDAGNAIVVGRNPGGDINVNNGAVPISGTPATVVNTSSIVINALGGNDGLQLDQTNGPLPGTTFNGGDGNDEMIGGDGADRFFGGAGNDFADGNRGADQFFGQFDDDLFQWDPGDGSDLVEGGDGTDELLFNGNNAAEQFKLVDAGKGHRATFTRDLGNIVMDLDDTERVTVNALGGADTVTVEDLGGTDVVDVAINLAAAGTTNGDNAADAVNLIGDPDDDNVDMVNPVIDNSIRVRGFHAEIKIVGTEAANDTLVVDTGAGDDTIGAGIPAGLLKLLTLNGGSGNDRLVGSRGVDLLLGGGGNDQASGAEGNDTFFGGGGADFFSWRIGDGSDTVEGDAGNDTLQFTANFGEEETTIGPNGTRSKLVNTGSNVTMDNNSVERIALFALGGDDVITVDDLAGTGVRNVDVNLNDSFAPGDVGNGDADQLIVNGTGGDDRIVARSGPEAGAVSVVGLAAKVNFVGVEGALDTLRINGLGGNDDIIASTVSASALALLHLDGGAGNDDLFGGLGDDLLDGGDDTDFLDGNAGVDTALNGETLEDVP